MKNLVAFVFFVCITSNNPPKFDYTSFSRFVMINLRLPEAVKRNCTWQYAIIKVTTDKNRTISKYQIENKTFSDLTNSFSYLKGYQFDKELKLSNCNIVFFVNIVNDRVDDCDITPTNEKNDAENVFKKYKLSHAKTQSHNRYINDIMTTIVYDSMR